MRAKSLEKFKTKVKEITKRSHNLEASVIETEPSYSRHSELLRYEIRYMRPSVSTAGQVDTHAHPLHENQAEESRGQPPHEEASLR